VTGEDGVGQQTASLKRAAVQRVGLDVTGELLPEDLLVLDELAVILIQLRISAQHLIVEVRESGVGRPQIPHGRFNDEGGRGLRLATNPAGEWGCRRNTEPGKQMS
jgi:hypothetical protein